MTTKSKLVVAVRTDLGMGVGKVAAQVAHAAVLATLEAAGSPRLDAWLRDGQGKVVVRVPSREALRERMATAAAAGVQASLVTDAGHTEVEPGTETCCAFGPDSVDRVDAVTGDLPLL